MKGKSLWLLIVFFILTVFIFPKEPLTAPYYENKLIKIISGSEPGGGYDRMARLLAKHLPKYIPGKPTLIVENMPGAGSLIAANYINIQKPDGLTIGAPQRGIPFAQLTKVDGVKFDVTKFAWIGSAAVEPMIFAIRSDHTYKNVDDLRKAKGPIYVPGAGPGAADYQFTFLLKEFLGLNFKGVNYPSGSAVRLAVERKEVDGMAGSHSSIRTFIDRGLLRPLVRCRVSEPGIEDIPVDEDLTTDIIGKTIMAMRASSDRLGRPYMAPPGTPAEVMNFLRDAFAKVAKDPELIEESKKFNMRVEYIPADECMKVLSYIFNQPDEIVKEFGKYIKF